MEKSPNVTPSLARYWNASPGQHAKLEIAVISKRRRVAGREDADFNSDRFQRRWAPPQKVRILPILTSIEITSARLGRAVTQRPLELIDVPKNGRIWAFLADG
jgi:hypothetical protein